MAGGRVKPTALSFNGAMSGVEDGEERLLVLLPRRCDDTEGLFIGEDTTSAEGGGGVFDPPLKSFCNRDDPDAYVPALLLLVLRPSFGRAVGFGLSGLERG